MATYFVGESSAGAADGSNWANRYGGLNAAEDRVGGLSAGDEVVFGPGVYRATLTVDHSGSVGSPITYTADVSGARTDGVGGIVRITGSDNDQTATRSNAIIATSKAYRTFRGFSFDTTTTAIIAPITCNNWIIEDCTLQAAASGVAIDFDGTGTNNTIRRCMFLGNTAIGIRFTHTSTVDNAAHLVENCLLLNHRDSSGIFISRVGGVVIRNCVLLGGSGAIRVGTALGVGQTLTVNNCIIAYAGTALQATTTTEFSEDYNTVFGNTTARSNVNAGANSVAHSPLFAPPILLAGIRFPWMFGALSQWSILAAKAGTSEASDDLFGTTRPATSSKKSWGAVQFIPALRDTGTVRTGTASLKLSDAGSHHMFVPVTAVSTTISIYVRWEADYAGTKPQMVIRQPGQSDITVTATGSAGAWELLTHTFTPAASPGYVVVVIRSNNTATSGSYSVFADDLSVS